MTDFNHHLQDVYTMNVPTRAASDPTTAYVDPRVRQIERIESEMKQDCRQLDDLFTSHNYSPTPYMEPEDTHGLHIDFLPKKKRKKHYSQYYLPKIWRLPSKKSEMVHLNELDVFKMYLIAPIVDERRRSSVSAAANAAGPQTGAESTTTVPQEQQAGSGDSTLRIETERPHRPSLYRQTKHRVDGMLEHLANFSENSSAFTASQQYRLNRLTDITLHINAKILYVIGFMCAAGLALASGAAAFFSNVRPLFIFMYAGGLSGLANASGYLLATVYARYIARAEDERQNIWNETRILYRNISFRLLNKYLSLKLLHDHHFSYNEALSHSMRENKLAEVSTQAQMISEKLQPIAQYLASYFQKKYVYEILDPLLQVISYILHQEPLTDSFLRNEENTLLSKHQLHLMKDIIFKNRQLIQIALDNAMANKKDIESNQPNKPTDTTLNNQNQQS